METTVDRQRNFGPSSIEYSTLGGNSEDNRATRLGKQKVQEEEEPATTETLPLLLKRVGSFEFFDLIAIKLDSHSSDTTLAILLPKLDMVERC